MTKKEKLKKLDENVLDLLIKHTGEDGDLGAISELSVAVNYLKANAVVSDKEKSTTEEDIQKRVREANKRRKQKEGNAGEPKS